MPCDYDKIRYENIREYGEGTRHLAFLGNLYTDKTHFIFELLQNAEDALASKVKFCLHYDRLEMFHDGREFNEKDVRGICGVGEGTKAEDLTKIGKFGIGFKSVYSYTCTPEIHSGKENFFIENYIRPFQVEPIDLREGEWTTLIVFPFNHSDVMQEVAYSSLRQRLNNLALTTLLFLKNIGEVTWDIASELATNKIKNEVGTLCRTSPKMVGNVSAVKVFRKFDNNGRLNNKLQQWLLFTRPIPLPESERIVFVEIAFKIVESEIAPINDSPLFVFFPTEKATRLGFLIHGPYQTTPARDNISPDEPWNQHLIHETTVLLNDALLKLRDEKFVNISLLEALPIRSRDFPEESIFYPIFNSVKKMFQEEQLLPSSGDDFVQASLAKIADSSPLRQLFSKEQLNLLFFNKEEALGWIDGGVSENKTPDLWSYLRNELKIEEVRPEKVASLINKDFLESQSDEWIIRFYHFIADRKALYRRKTYYQPEGAFRTKEFIRLSTGVHVTPFNATGSPNVYLGALQGTDIPTVKKTILEDEECLLFLKDIGLAEPDITDEVVKIILPKYADGKFTRENGVPTREHFNDVKKIIQVYKKSTGRDGINELISRTPFLKTVTHNNFGSPGKESHDVDELVRLLGGPDPTVTDVKCKYRQPSQTYINRDILKKYFGSVGDAFFLDSIYSANGFSPEDWSEIGVMTYPGRRKYDLRFSPQKKMELRNGEGSTREENINGFKLHGLTSFLEFTDRPGSFSEKKEKSILLWKLLTEIIEAEDSKYFYGSYHWFYRKPRIITFQSFFYKELLEAAWIPTLDGDFCQPSHAELALIATEFRGAPQLRDLLQFGGEVKRQSEQYRQQQTAADQLGVHLGDIELIKQNLELFREWKDHLQGVGDAVVEFPKNDSSNPLRREARVAAKATDAPEKTTEEKKRTVRTSKVDPGPWLRGQYTNQDDQLICQICRKEMPFRKRSGVHYFEKVELSNRLDFEDEKVFLATCPVCAAKYKEYVKNQPEAQNKVVADILETNGNIVPLVLDSIDSSLSFTGKHIGDLRTILGTKYRLPVNDLPTQETEAESGNIFIEPDPIEMMQCPLCDVKVLKENFENHLEEVHRNEAVRSPSGSKRMIQCPKCNSKVRWDRLEKHLINVHGPNPVRKRNKNVSGTGGLLSSLKKRNSSRRSNSTTRMKCPGCGAVNGCYCR